MFFRKIKTTYITKPEEMQEHLFRCLKYRNKIEESIAGLKAGTGLKLCYNLKLNLTNIELKYTSGLNNYQRYIFYLSGKDEIIEHVSGMQAFSDLQRMTKKAVIDLSQNENYYYYDEIEQKRKCKLSTIAGLLYSNKNYMNQRFKGVYSYDVNSSYAWGMLQDMPDTSVEPKAGIVQENEIGFAELMDEYGDVMLFMVKTGEFAEWIFPKIKSPFINFVNYYYVKKAAAKNKIERQKYKDILNFSTGYMRRKNPFIHAAILSYCRDRIKSLIDENTIYSNTDSIVSLNRRYDIEKMVGDGVGMFKIEHNNETFALAENGYQWNDEIPGVRGVAKEWFKNIYPNGFDILRDELPYVEGNKYILDIKNMKILSIDFKNIMDYDKIYNEVKIYEKK